MQSKVLMTIIYYIHAGYQVFGTVHEAEQTSKNMDRSTQRLGTHILVGKNVTSASMHETTTHSLLVVPGNIDSSRTSQDLLWLSIMRMMLEDAFCDG